MNDLKSKYKQDFEQIRTHMNEFDPCGLIALGSPIDEYDYLTNKILSSVYRGESRDKIKETILFELEGYFGEDVKTFLEQNREKFYADLDKLLDKLQN